MPGHGRADGRAAGTILNDSTTIFIDFHKKHPKTLCFSVVSRPAEAQVPIFTAQMKKASKKCQKNRMFFDFSNQANAQVPIFTVQKSIFGRRPGSSQSPEMEHEVRLATHQQRAGGQDDVSLNKLPQMSFQL